MRRRRASRLFDPESWCLPLLRDDTVAEAKGLSVRKRQGTPTGLSMGFLTASAAYIGAKSAGLIMRSRYGVLMGLRFKRAALLQGRAIDPGVAGVYKRISWPSWSSTARGRKLVFQFVVRLADNLTNFVPPR